MAFTDLHAVEGAVTACTVEIAGRRALALRSDATDPKAVTALLARAEAELGPPDVIANRQKS